MGFKVTTLMENNAEREGLATEHGLSLLVESGSFRLLYDTGSTEAFLKNAEVLGINMDGIDALVFSHGHFDHTGGTRALFDRGNLPAAVYLGPAFFEGRYSKKKDTTKDIGARISEEDLKKSGIPWSIIGKEPVKLYGPDEAPEEGMYLLAGFETTEEMERPAANLVREREGRLEPDRFEDEVALVLVTEKNLCLVSGCSHVGILSMCRRVEAVFGRPVTMFLGGTHLMDADDLRIETTCRLLKQRGMHRLGACHCNGENAGHYFEAHFPGFFRNHTGSVAEVE